MTEWNTKLDEGPLFVSLKTPRRSHRHSAKALDAHAESGKLSKRCEAILTALRNFQGDPMTDRQIKDALMLPDMNSVRPRITEMIRDGILEEAGSVTCPVTKMTVRKVAIKGS